MQRINSRTVALSPDEQFARIFFEACLDEGADIRTAVQRTKEANAIFASLSQKFYDYLAD